MQPPDRTLALLAIAGDRRAYADLVRATQPWLTAALRRACGDPVQAEDLAQAAYLKAWTKLPALREPAAFAGWLRQIGINLAIDAARTRLAIEPIETEALPQTQSETSLDDRIDLDTALARLPAAPRLCVVLAFVEGRSHAEIAEQLGLPLGTVKSHIARGLARLQAALADGDEDGTRR